MISLSANAASAPEASAPGESIVSPALRFSREGTETIPIVTRTPFVAFTIPFQVKPPRESRTVVVKGTFDIVPGGPAQIRSEADPPSGDVNTGGDPMKSLSYPSDFAIFKPRADVTLKGHAHAPGGHSPAAEVRFRFGHRGRGFERRIAVFGERRWQRGVIKLAPTPPKPFEKMPLVYERAFGGPERDRNPVGIGGQTLLPNLEDPDHLVTSPEDAPAPACFAGISVHWPARRSKLGTYDGPWVETRWPYLPDDLDWTHFQAAPAEQQLDSLEGDEPFELVGMHPKHPVIRGSLPRLRPRCFMQETTAAGAAFREVVLRLDTVSFDVDEMKLNLVWRGLLDVSDDEASDIAELFVMREDAGTKRLGIEEAYAKYLATRLPLSLVAESPDEPPPGNDGAAPDGAESALERMIRDKLRSAGLGGAAAFVVALTEPELDAEAKGALESQATAAPPAHLPPERDPIRAAVVARLASGEPLDELDLAGANLSDLDFSERSLSFANLKEARLCGCRFARANLSGAQLAKADLEDAVLDGATLIMADLTGANLTGASAVGAEISSADLSGARGDRASFREARGAHARFTGGSWKGARFDRAELAMANFTRAELDDAVFDGAVMPTITLYEARGANVSWKGADLTEARADGASLLRSSFFEAVAPSSNWEGAVLDESTFLDAVLTGANLPRASCAKVVFSGADLVGAQLTRAKLPGASLLKANLMNASLESADLTGADLRGANLHGAETWKAKLRGARLELAIVTKTKLSERSR